MDYLGNFKRRKPYDAMNKKWIEILVHVIAWVIFLSLPTFFKQPHPGDSHTDILGDLLFTPRLPNSILLILVFYFNYYVAIPRFYFKKKYGALLISFFVCFGLLLLLGEVLRPPEMTAGGRNMSNLLGPSHNLFMFINVYAFSFAFRLYVQWRRVREEQLKTEVSFLKAQINPHFLFNTLNSIYSLTLTKSDKAPDAVVQLSSLMRYSVTDAEKAMVPLSKELDYIRDYIALQELRLTDKVDVKFTISGIADGKEIAPFILTPFIENAFKYGVNPEENSVINISVDISTDNLVLEVVNNKVYVQKDEYSVSGLGIANTRKRLQYLYAKRHELVIEDSDDTFKIHLVVNML